MNKILVIVAHPDIENSVINQRWIAELNNNPNKFTVHNLYKTYPDGAIDVLKEQQLLESYETIIFQFPFYWFSCPPLLKKWIDETITYGWAYGSTSAYKMKDKKIALAISAGIDEQEYAASGKYKYTLAQLTTPFELTFEYVRADYKYFFAYYGIELNATPEWIEKSVTKYMDFVDTL